MFNVGDRVECIGTQTASGTIIPIGYKGTVTFVAGRHIAVDGLFGHEGRPVMYEGAFKLIKPVTEKSEQVFNPIYCRDRIKEIDSMVESLEEERVSLVQALEDEGFSLIEKINKQLEECKQSHESMNSWRNWKEGDRIQVIESGMDETEEGDMCTVVRFDKSDANQPIYLENDEGMYHWPVLSDGHFNLLKWHSRPQ